MRLLGLVCAYVLVTPLLLANAEPRRTLQEVTLRKKPGERSAAVGQLAANTPVTVLGQEGRWLLVRANNVSGYLTRTTVSEPDPASAGSAGEPAGGWSAMRKQGGKLVAELFVQVAAPTAALRATPTPDAAQVVEVARGERLVVVDAARDPAWIHARDRAGHDGWIARDQIEDGASSIVITGGQGTDGADGAGGGDLRGLGRARGGQAVRGPAGRLAVRADLGIGFRALGMTLTSNASGGLTNYVLAADAAAATVDVDATMRPSGTVFVAVDARVSASDSSPGIDYPGPTAPAGKIAFRTFGSDAGVRVGVRTHRAFDLALRAGGHYDAFLATNVDNAGMLPRERLLGATLGARVDIAPEPSRFTITARFDALALGARKQTPGLEDGTASTARALWGGVTMRYALVHHLAVFGGYDFGRASTAWSGMSIRQPGATRTQRIDTTQLVQLGISTEL